MQIRRLGHHDAQNYRALRMRALAEFPAAFTSSYEEEVKQPLAACEIRLDGGHRHLLL